MDAEPAPQPRKQDPERAGATLFVDVLRIGLGSPVRIPAVMPSRLVSNSGQTAPQSHGRQCLCVGSELSCNPHVRSARARMPWTRALSQTPNTHNVAVCDPSPGSVCVDPRRTSSNPSFPRASASTCRISNTEYHEKHSTTKNNSKGMKHLAIFLHLLR